MKLFNHMEQTERDTVRSRHTDRFYMKSFDEEFTAFLSGLQLKWTLYMIAQFVL